jgi:hypothetical protein
MADKPYQKSPVSRWGRSWSGERAIWLPSELRRPVEFERTGEHSITPFE